MSEESPFKINDPPSGEKIEKADGLKKIQILISPLRGFIQKTKGIEQTANKAAILNVFSNPTKSPIKPDKSNANEPIVKLTVI